MDEPRLIVVAGCNGSGKSSFSSTLVPDGIVPFDYDKVFLKLYNTLLDIDIKERMAHNMARKNLEQSIETAIENSTHFCYETNFNSTPLHWPRLFKESGYTLEMIYFCLDSIEEAKRRVQIRVENGGHFVPEKEIEQRFFAGYQNLNQHFNFFDHVHLFDTNRYNSAPMHLLSIIDGKGLIHSNSPSPNLSKLLPEIVNTL